MSKNPKWVLTKEAVKLTGLQGIQLWNAASRGETTPVKQTPRRVYWLKDDVIRIKKNYEQKK